MEGSCLRERMARMGAARTGKGAPEPPRGLAEARRPCKENLAILGRPVPQSGGERAQND
ncbi:hypothetical protein JL2886_03094 [Phaeobacter gallaeciensis]|uniref:Uncharacterized protein n=1 Tax=Phaeobacter gallaeciensis TaxID=60890 RepID=A0A1B0ZV32_9RHOB|nr:hypothetical protein JL2886_03094 [Phaeobacter gallaeciensis]